MRQFAVIGLGNFGSRVVKRLTDEGFPVLAVDKDPVRVEYVQAYVTQAIQTDATVQGSLDNLGFGDMETAIVSLGDNFEASVMVTMSLKELEVPNIIVKGISREHKKILELLGANKVVFPEEDAAIHLAKTIAQPGILDHFSLVEGYSIVELLTPESFVGHSLLELNLRRRFKVECLAIKSENGNSNTTIQVIPSADTLIKDGDRLILLATDADIENFQKE